MAAKPAPTAKPMFAIEARFRQSQQEFEEHRPLTQHVQAELQDEVDVLRAQEGWDRAAAEGVNEWIWDSGSIFRAVRRNRYDARKTVQSLLSVAQRRADRGLHGPVPTSSPYAGSDLFYILPVPQFTDRLQRPIAVLSIREVVRDADGKFDDMKEWLWWALEMTRRVLRDWWVRGVFPGAPAPIGKGGEGCVLLVDAAGGGYRNLEVELLPTLLPVGHNDFPGLFERVFVVNTGWGQRSMWSIVKRVLPRSALDKIMFLDKHEDVAAAFELDHLPKAFGGTVDYSHKTGEDDIIQRYSQQPSFDAHSAGPSRIDSCSTMADIFYTARNTPTNSRTISRRSSIGNVNSGLVKKLKLSSCTAQDAGGDSTPSPSASASNTSSGRSTPTSQPPSGQGQAVPTGDGRIKSLTDFHLYLSPSRLAHIDLLSDSDGEGSTPRKPVPLLARRRTLRPAILEPNLTSRAGILATQNTRPPLRLHGIPKHVMGDMDARSYSDQLQRHHAVGLGRYAAASPPAVEALDREIGAPREFISPSSTREADIPEGQGSRADQSPVERELTPPTLVVEASQDIPTYATNSNPWFGYPAIRVPDPKRPGSSSVRPRYARNRKRDLVKTLVFLFLIRLQSIRDAIERFLRLDRLASWINGRARIAEQRLSPAQGLLQSAKERQTPAGLTMGKEIVQAKEKDWVWMIIGFLLLRGTWMGVLTAPLNALGLEGVKGLLGLA